MDVRVKTFADEATKQLDFVRRDHGFAGPEISYGELPGAIVRVGYHRAGTAIEASLVFWYMGEEYVATTQIVDAADGIERRTEIGHDTAHTGYQMRRALKLHADAVRTMVEQA